jgi:hypothetical protein
VTLASDLERIAAAAASFADDGEQVTGVLAAEAKPGERVYLCAFSGGDGQRAWLALDREARPVTGRAVVRDAVSIAALCELAADTAGGGDLAELRSQLVTLRITERPEGIEEAEEAALALEQAIGSPPRLATPDYLDTVGAATRRLELALGEGTGSPFAQALKSARQAVDSLTVEVESAYKQELS